MRYEFTKMQSVGNDFIVFDGVSHEIDLTAETVRRLADRHFGIGCDQILVAQPAEDDTHDFVFKIFNHDGSEAEQCGNGARCLARFLHERGLTKAKTIRIRTSKQSMALNINADESVTVEMGLPEFELQKIPFVAESSDATEQGENKLPSYTINLEDESVEISVVAIGNPHAVQRVQRVADAPLSTLGSMISNHPQFPSKANVGFMQVVDKQHIQLRVYERGVGETLGCGSGACAAVAIGITAGWLKDKVTVSLPGGDVEVSWQQPESPILLTGSAHTVFCGSVEW